MTISNESVYLSYSMKNTQYICHSFYYSFQPHRVLLPEKDYMHRTRRCIAFFANPDDDVMITCLDGCNKYKPIKTLDYMFLRFSNTLLDWDTEKGRQLPYS